MRTIRASAYLIFFLLMLAFVPNAGAQGVIVPGPCERCGPRPPRPINLPPRFWRDL